MKGTQFNSGVHIQHMHSNTLPVVIVQHCSRLQIVWNSLVSGHTDCCIGNLSYQSSQQSAVESASALFNMYELQRLPESFIAATLLSQPCPRNLWQLEQALNDKSLFVN